MHSQPRKARKLVEELPQMTDGAGPSAAPVPHCCSAEHLDEEKWSARGSSSTPLEETFNAEAVDAMDDENLPSASLTDVRVDIWVQCDACFHWRHLPDNYKVSFLPGCQAR